jgi:predicted RNA polymerase sigma factor
MEEILLQRLTPEVIGLLVRRGADFAADEDAVQEALVEAVRRRPADPSPGSAGAGGTALRRGRPQGTQRR